MCFIIGLVYYVDKIYIKNVPGYEPGQTEDLPPNPLIITVNYFSTYPFFYEII